MIISAFHAAHSHPFKAVSDLGFCHCPPVFCSCTAPDHCSAPDVKNPWFGLGPVSTGNSKTEPQLARTLRSEAEAGQDRDGTESLVYFQAQTPGWANLAPNQKHLMLSSYLIPKTRCLSDPFHPIKDKQLCTT